MKRDFVLKHWLATLFLAPFFLELYELAFGKVKGQVISLFEIHPVTFLFSLLFSLPALILCHFVFTLLMKKQVGPGFTKLLLISLTVSSIVVTVLVLGGTLSTTLIFAYSISAIVSGALLRIKTDRNTPSELPVRSLPNPHTPA